ncbi:hypothetical protein AB0J43_02075 [Nonomuraea fuscirosea]
MFEVAETLAREGHKEWGTAVVWEHMRRPTQDGQGHQRYQPHKNCPILQGACLVFKDEVAGFVLRQEWLQARLDEKRIYERLERLYAELKGRS